MIPVLLLALTAALIVVYVTWKQRGEAGGRGWPWFLRWLVAGFLMAFGVLSFGIGLFILPLAVGTLIWVARRSPHLRESSGFVVGIGAVLLVIAFIHRDDTPCPAGGLVLPANAPPGTTVSCGGANPHPWLIAGVFIATIGLILYGAQWLRLTLRAR